MTLKEMKIKTFSLIEEYYPELTNLAEDEDVINKINGVVNSIQLELMKLRKINAKLEVVITKEDSKTIDLKNLISDCYQIKSIIFDEEVESSMPNDDTLILPKEYEGNFTIYYYKYPNLVTVEFDKQTETEDRQDEDESYVFELEPDVLEVMPYGIAADLLKMDMISGYGRYFKERYNELKASIDSRKISGTISITGGVDI